MYGIDSNRLANKKSILSNTNNGDNDQEFDECKMVLSFLHFFPFRSCFLYIDIPIGNSSS